MFIPTSLLTRLFPLRLTTETAGVPRNPQGTCLTDLRARPAIPKRGTLTLEGLNPKGDPFALSFLIQEGRGRHLRELSELGQVHSSSKNVFSTENMKSFVFLGSSPPKKKINIQLLKKEINAMIFSYSASKYILYEPMSLS